MSGAARTRPDLEVVDVQPTQSFKIWSHGYPFRTVRWHFHPEYEIHLVTTTTGRCFVGDHIGVFGPGHLVMTGPNLPHNWVSDIPDGTHIEQRCLVLQFTIAFASGCAALFPDMQFLAPLLADSDRGLEFGSDTGAAAEPVMTELLEANGARRIELFFGLLGLMQRSATRRKLASVSYHVRAEEHMAQPLNRVLAHIARNLSGDLRETDLAALCGWSPSVFCRAFRRHTGMTFVDYVNSLRINRACEMLIGGQARVSEICFDVGFNNLSNFNRQFLERKAMAPTAFRVQHRMNAGVQAA